MLKFNVLNQPHSNESRRVQRIIEYTNWVSTQYQMLDPSEKAEFESALKNLTEQPKTANQTANLGGEAFGENNENKTRSDSILNLLKAKKQPKPSIQPNHLLLNKTEIPTPEGQPKKLWLNKRAE
jgi:hypothetical protein